MIPMNDRKITVSIGKNKFDTQWIPTSGTWLQFVDVLLEAHKTNETFEEFRSMSDEMRGAIKNGRAFVGGNIVGGNRKSVNVRDRDLVTLDMDHPDRCAAEICQMIKESGCEAVVYTTHSATEENPRMRVVIPLTRTVDVDVFSPVARAVALKLGMGLDIYDDTTYQETRLMYFSSTARDGYHFAKHNVGNFVDPDAILLELGIDVDDETTWPCSSRKQKLRNRRKKMDVIINDDDSASLQNAFNQTYFVESAIETFLPDIYEQAYADRYTYLLSDSGVTAGLVVYCDGGFASFHESDPARDPWSYDSYGLVMAHKFGIDYEAKMMMDEWIGDELNDVVEKQKELLLAKIKSKEGVADGK